jgi:hypothetical protein
MGLRFHLAFLVTLGFLSSFGALSVQAVPNEVSFLVIGDWGTGTDNQRQLAQQLEVSARKIGARFVISTGDNFYSDGLTSTTDAQFNTKFESRGGSVCLNSLRAIVKWISASVTPPPGLALAN